MKSLFLTFEPLVKTSGITKKVLSQVNSLTNNGLDIALGYINNENDNHSLIISEKEIYAIKNKGLSKLRYYFVIYDQIVKYVLKNNIQFIYIRYTKNPLLFYFLRRAKKNKTALFLEIPTYPYSKEIKLYSMKKLLHRIFEQFNRYGMNRYVDRIITYSNHSKIYRIPTIRISNGIDFNQICIKRKMKAPKYSKEIKMLGVADLNYWHGYDRLIRGLAQYYDTNPELRIYFNLVGGHGLLLDGYKKIVEKLNLSDYVIFWGTLPFDELDHLFDECDLGIGSLGRHRSGIKYIKTLKNREYAARGIPFIYSEIDEDFEGRNFIFKIPPDESNVDIFKVIDFYRKCETTPEIIRNSIESILSWDVQMRFVVLELENCLCEN